MKVVFKKDSELDEDTIVISASKKLEIIDELVNTFLKRINNNFLLYKRNKEYYINDNTLLFFETSDNKIMAHTIDEVFISKSKLYELEEQLPSNFIRISKSVIVNIDYIISIAKTISSSRLIEFRDTYKKVYVSRFYYKNLKEKLKERSK